MTLTRTKFLDFIKNTSPLPDRIGNAPAHYGKVYDKHSGKKWFISWNWAAFFWGLLGLPLVWMLYRRMYRYVGFCLLGLVGLMVAMYMFYVFSIDTRIYHLFPSLLASFWLAVGLLFGGAQHMVRWAIEVSGLPFSAFFIKKMWVFLQVLLAIGFGAWGDSLYFNSLKKESLPSQKKSAVILSFISIMLVIAPLVIFKFL